MNQNTVTDQILQDFFNDENLKFAHKRKGANRPAVLQSIDNTAVNHNKSTSLHISHSTSSLQTNSQIKVNSKVQKSSRSTKEHQKEHHERPVESVDILAPKQPLKVDDYNRISDLMHRVVTVSGCSPTKEKQQDYRLLHSNVDIARNIKEVQLQALRDSETLKDIMNCVVHCYDELQEVITTHLNYRKEVSFQVQDINRTYIELFEQMLKQVLLSQRTKFKSQTATIEELNHEILRLQNLRVEDTEHVARLEAEKSELMSRIVDMEEKILIFKGEVNVLKHRVEQYETEERQRRESSDNNSKDYKELLKQTVNELKVVHAGHLENIRLQYMKEKGVIQHKLDILSTEHEITKKKLHDAEQKSSAFQKDVNTIVFKRPNRENSSQTEITSDGYWDRSDGWVLPISKTTLARNHWRQSLRFAHCSSCRGVGKYIAKAVALFKSIKRGPELIPSTQLTMTDIECKWSLPDDYARFLSNLPKSMMAFNPRTVQWVVRIATYLLNYKYKIDCEDARLGYNCQTMNEYVVEMFLLKLENRSDAEIGIYKLLVTLREHYRKHHLLTVFARLLGVIDTPSLEEQEAFHREEQLNEAALRKKKELEVAELKPRLRAKILQHIAREKEVLKGNATGANNAQFIHHIVRSYKALDLDILTIYLYARQCLLYNNYTGVYAKRIRDIKAKSLSLAVAQNALMGNLQHHTQSSELDLIRMQKEQIYTVDLADIPDHLCIGENCVNWIPLDRAVRVMKVFTASLSGSELMAVHHSIENHATFLYHDGRLDLPEGMHTLIRKVTRLFLYSTSDDGGDISWFTAYQTYQNPLNGEGDGSAGNDPATENDDFQSSQSHGGKGKEMSTVSGNSSSVKTHSSNRTYSKNEKSSVGRHTINTTNTNNSHSTKRGHHPLDGQSMFSAHNSSTHQNKQSDNSPKKEKRQRIIEMRGGVLLDLNKDTHATNKYYEESHPDTVMVNMDHLLQLIVDTMLQKCTEVETRLKTIFVEGDTNHDGVLSVQEFTAIASKAAPEFSQRKILKMYREALQYGDDNDSIGPDGFLHVCKAYGLVKVLDIDELRMTQLRAISDPLFTREKDFESLVTKLQSRPVSSHTHNNRNYNTPSYKYPANPIPVSNVQKKLGAVHRRSDVHFSGPRQHVHNHLDKAPLHCTVSHRVTFAMGQQIPEQQQPIVRTAESGNSDSDSDGGDDVPMSIANRRPLFPLPRITVTNTSSSTTNSTTDHHDVSPLHINFHRNDTMGNIQFNDSFRMEGGVGSSFVSPAASRNNSPRLSLTTTNTNTNINNKRGGGPRQPPAPIDFSSLTIVGANSQHSQQNSHSNHNPSNSDTPSESPNPIMRVSVKTKQQVLEEEAAALRAQQKHPHSLNKATASSSMRAVTIIRPEDISKLLQEQHQEALKGVDVKALVQNDTASKSSAETMMAQLRLRREMRNNNTNNA